MIIDIDIKIADSNGKMLQHFVKRLDNIDSTDDRLSFSLDLGKSFEHFLAEYMSYSGRRIQEKLFTDNKYPLYGRYYLPNGSFMPSEEVQFNEDLTSGGAIQGDEGLPAAKEIPFQHQENILQKDLPTDKKVESREIQYLIRIGNGSIFSGKFPVKQLIEVRDMRGSQESESVNSPEAEGEDLSYLMQKAIEKYETTFYHITQDQEAGDFYSPR